MTAVRSEPLTDAVLVPVITEERGCRDVEIERLLVRGAR